MPTFLTSANIYSLYKHNPGTNYALQTYGGDFMGLAQGLPRFQTRKDWLTGYGLDNNASVLVIGAGFGYLMQALYDAGITDVYGLEPGDWFWDVAQDSDWPSAEIKGRVAQDWAGSGTEKDALNAIGVGGQAQFTYVVDEDCITMHTDAELSTFISACEDRLQGNAKGRIIHVVTLLPEGGPGDSSVNWKTAAEWKAIAPDHTWVDVRDGTVI